MSSTSLWVYGCLGGVLPVIVRLAKATFTDTPAFKLSLTVLVGILAMAFLGGLMANLLNLDKIEIPNGSPRLVVVLVGYASLDILASLAGAIGGKVITPSPAPPPAPAPAEGTENLIRFLKT